MLYGRTAGWKGKLVTDTISEHVFSATTYYNAAAAFGNAAFNLR